MEVVTLLDDGKAIVNVKGRIDTNTAPQLEEALKPVIDENSKVCLDFSEVEYVSSAGLRVLLASHKLLVAKGGLLVIRHVNDAVMEVLDMTGFSSFLNIED